MSSTRRGNRLGGDEDNYPTRPWMIHRLLERWQPRAGEILEPTAGDGAIIRVLRERLGDRTIHAIECRATCEVPLLEAVAGNGTVAIADLLRYEPPAGRFDRVTTVLDNPPFIIAEAVIRRARALAPAADIGMLLRMGFMESDERDPFYEEFGMPDCYPIPNRPSFRTSVKYVIENGKKRKRTSKTDSATYAWMIWPAGPARAEGRIIRLASTPAAERGVRAVKRRHPRLVTFGVDAAAEVSS